MFVGKVADVGHSYIVVPQDKMVVIEFFTENEKIYSNHQILYYIIRFVRGTCLLRRTYEMDNRAKLRAELCSIPKRIQQLLIHAFNTVIPCHYGFMFALFTGHSSFEQVTKDVMSDPQKIYRNGKVENIQVPKFVVPKTFIVTVARALNIPDELYEDSKLSQGGYHSLKLCIAALQSFYELGTSIAYNSLKFHKILYNFVKLYTAFIQVRFLHFRYIVKRKMENQFSMAKNGESICKGKSTLQTP